MATRIAMVVDESGSMSSLLKATRDGFDEYIQDLKSDDADEVTVSLTTFSASVTRRFTNVEPSKIGSLESYEYWPNGSTALYDGITDAVFALEESVGPRDRAIVVVITDGYENASRYATRQQVLDLIKKKEATERWTFAYIGANQNAFSVGNQMGFQAGNTYSVGAATMDSMSQTYSKLASDTKRFRGGMQTASNVFLSEDDDTVIGSK